MKHRSSGTLALGALILSCLALTPPAHAATFTSTGVACTITGTPGADHLTGTAGRDVICGLGGNDVINGGGGNDLIDGGAGADTVNGGAGNDVLRGGPGADHLAGADGADTVTGGDGGDTLVGGSGPDDLQGNSGNDDLTGGTGADDIQGDGGTNWCTVGPNDTQTGCKYDLQPPDSSQATYSTDQVDVTNKSETVTVRVHVTDDTGVSEVRVTASPDDGSSTLIGYGDLVDGTVRDGWWEASVMVAHWSPATTYPLTVTLRDRVGRQVEQTYPGQVLRVVDRNPDTDLPAVDLISPGPGASYDVRSTGQDVTVKARITDAVSGVWYADLCLYKPQDGYYTNLPCAGGDLVSGDVHDGVWSGDVRIPKGDVGGDWNVSVMTIDLAHKDQSPVQWLGPDLYRNWTNDGQNVDPSTPQLPDGRGRFSVVGTTDQAPPHIDSFTVTPSQVDTLNAPATVTFSVHGGDNPGGGVTGVGLALMPLGNPDNDLFPTVDLHLDSGTYTDGTWTGTLDIPQGSPPETYTFQVWVQDVSHWRSYSPASSPLAGDADQQLLPGDPKLVVGSGAS